MKQKLAVHKFSSCDGCQLAFLNDGEALLALTNLVDIVHFVEAGIVNPEAMADIAFIEGSISTPDELTRIKRIRDSSKFLITIGACATAGGIQALRNFAQHENWLAQVYASPQYIHSLETCTAIAQHVKVDLELWGCPVNSQQVLAAIKSLLHQARPHVRQEKVCLECKRKGQVCVLVTGQQACMGPVTQTGCGALCPGVNRGCYACYGPGEEANPYSLGGWFLQLGFSPEEIKRQFLHINNQAPVFKTAGEFFQGIPITYE